MSGPKRGGGQKGGRGKFQKKDLGPRVNDQIRAQELRLVSESGEPHGVVTLAQAKIIANNEGLDLVEISPNAKPPVVKLIDYGKFKYQAQKRANEAKKKQVIIALKEVKFRPNIDVHDLDVKLRNTFKFLDQGDKVKMLMQFRGREMAHKEIGLTKFRTIIDQALDHGAVIEAPMKMMGNRAFVLLAPSKKKT
ncbi:translation initiation factor IF-3 [Bacteriovoracaceae bacterium]|nr:translation initiation factor IF-3 [Bacteriovoracaceae bacterium]